MVVEELKDDETNSKGKKGIDYDLKKTKKKKENEEKVLYRKQNRGKRRYYHQGRK